MDESSKPFIDTLNMHFKRDKWIKMDYSVQRIQSYFFICPSFPSQLREINTIFFTFPIFNFHQKNKRF